MNLESNKPRIQNMPDEIKSFPGFENLSGDDIRKAQQALQFLEQVRSARRSCPELQETAKPLVSTNRQIPAGRHDAEITEHTNHHFALHAQGRTIGRFEILRSIGRGGFAEVLLARDPKLDRLVAVKIPSFRALASSDSRSRFTREAEAAAMLSHPAIVPVYETGNAGPVDFIAYQYCAGDSLAAWFESQNRHVQPEIAAQIIHRIAQAVQHAHQRGVVHRDLKPQNVLIAEDTHGKDVAQQLRITDFGLAKYVMQTDQSLTLEGSVLGTPAYMSPEQARGAKEINAATDIYSMGVMLYELLTGQLPHRKDSHLATMRAIEYEQPKPPRRLSPMVPRDLEAICLKCLDKLPARRYATANDLVEDLQSWLEGKIVSARHAGSLERLARWSQRNKMLAASLSFAFLSLAAGLGLSLWQWKQSEANLLSSNIQRDRAHKNVNMLESTVDRVLNQFVRELETNPRLSEFQTGVLNELLTVHRLLVDDEAEQLQEKLASIKSYLRIAEIYRDSLQTDQAINVCKQALALADNADESDADYDAIQKLRINVLTLLGIMYLQHEPYIQSQTALETARRDLQRIRRLYSGGEMLAVEYAIVRHLQLCYRAQKNRKKSKQADRDLQEIATAMIREIESYPQKSRENHNSVMFAIIDLARIEQGAGNHEAYFQRLQQALAYAKNLEQIEPVDRGVYAYTLAQLAEYYLRSGDLPNATKYNDLLVQCREAQIQKNPDYADAIQGMLSASVRRIRILVAQDQLELANEAFQDVIQQTRGANNQQYKFDSLTMLYKRYADFLNEQLDDPGAAVENYKLALEIGKDFASQPESSVGVRDHIRDAAFGAAKIFAQNQPDQANELMQLALANSKDILRISPGTRSHQNRAIDITRTIADGLIQLDKYSEACRLWDELNDVEPDSPHLRYQTSQYLAEALAQAKEQGVADSEQLQETRKSALNHLTIAVDAGLKNSKLFQRPMWRVFSDNQLQPFLDSMESENHSDK